MRLRPANGVPGRRVGDRAPWRGLLPLLALAGAVLAATVLGYLVMMATAAGGPAHPGTVVLYAAAGCFLLAAGAVVVVQGSRHAKRVAGPEYRLVQSLRRMRTGDLSFRVSLRRGDLLTGLADECNALLDWLNANPPSGARTGTDLFEVEVDPDAADEERAHGHQEVGK